MSVTWAVDTGDGPAGPGAGVQVPAASTIKVLVAVAFWRRAAAGGLDPDEPVAHVPPAGEGAVLDVLPGIGVTLAHLAALMLCVSDNAATNVLLERLGFDAVNAEAERLALSATRARRRMLDWDAAAAGRENVTSAGDLARLLRLLADPAAIAPAVAEPVLRALAATEHRDLIGEVVPEPRLAGLKRGYSDRANHDCALVEGPAGPFGMAVCSSPPAAPDALRAAAREALRAAGVDGPGI